MKRLFLLFLLVPLLGFSQSMANFRGAYIPGEVDGMSGAVGVSFPLGNNIYLEPGFSVVHLNDTVDYISDNVYFSTGYWIGDGNFYSVMPSTGINWNTTEGGVLPIFGVDQMLEVENGVWIMMGGNTDFQSLGITLGLSINIAPSNNCCPRFF